MSTPPDWFVKLYCQYLQSTEGKQMYPTNERSEMEDRDASQLKSVGVVESWEPPMTNFEMVREFHKVFKHLIAETPGFPTDKLRDLRMDFIDEEIRELWVAHVDRNIVGVADALSDLIYFVYGMALVYGIDLDACFKEVHDSNMSKLGADGQPIYSETGKVMKGPNFRLPDLKRVLFPTRPIPMSDGSYKLSETPEPLLPASYWERKQGIRITGATGWIKDQTPWIQPITEADFNERKALSRIDYNDTEQSGNNSYTKRCTRCKQWMHERQAEGMCTQCAIDTKTIDAVK